MNYGFQTNKAAVTLTTARWDDAPVGQNAGTGKIAIPSGSRIVYIVTAATPLCFAMDETADIYTDNGATARHEDGASIQANADADSPEAVRPVPVNAAYLHIKGAGATSVTFFGI